MEFIGEMHMYTSCVDGEWQGKAEIKAEIANSFSLKTAHVKS